MSVHKSDEFIADVESQFEWYGIHADWNIAERYLKAIEATGNLLAQHPLLGPRTGFSHPSLVDWRFMVVFQPFQKHIVFYEPEGDHVLLRRAMHEHRNVPEKLL
jgi:plasmid stabilization system protein ParE